MFNVKKNFSQPFPLKPPTLSIMCSSSIFVTQNLHIIKCFYVYNQKGRILPWVSVHGNTNIGLNWMWRKLPNEGKNNKETRHVTFTIEINGRL